MKKFVVPVVCALVGCAAGVAMPAITAQSFSTPANVVPLQAFCERVNNRTLSEAVLRNGAQGFHITVVTGGGTACFERPAQ
ncbi:MAG: hypothetical protein R3B40_14330 [Polyangiales bacterium]|nr:hypothetical protein [Sandaracinaceae bacterium]